MNREEFLNLEPFSIPQAEKERFYREQMNELSANHRNACKAYDDICNGLHENGPYLPVSLFKDTDLKSVPEDKIIRKITSSGTTGQQVPKIYLDAETSALSRGRSAPSPVISSAPGAFRCSSSIHRMYSETEVSLRPEVLEFSASP